MRVGFNAEGLLPASQRIPRPRALVTGASSGIGRAFARHLARDGFDLVLVGRRPERLEQVVRECEIDGAKAEVIIADLGISDGLGIVEKRAAVGDVTMLVNNAGFQSYMPFVDLDPQLAARQIQVQATAVARLTRAVRSEERRVGEE